LCDYVHPTDLVTAARCDRALAPVRESVLLWAPIFFGFWLHNHLVFTLQRNYCRRGVPFVIVSIRVE
jgi:hypothetical protein